MPERTLVLGGGHLGSFLARCWQLPPELHWKADLDQLDDETLRDLRPDVIVNCAGKTDLAWCESNPLECFRSNVAAPLALYRRIGWVFGRHARYLHLSSGCVWDGPFRRDGTPFHPADPPSPACFYSWTKAAVDALLLQELSTPLLILRPRQLYSPDPVERNSLIKLCRYPRLVDTPNSMTSADTVRRTIETALTASPTAWNRVLAVYDRGIITPLQVGRLLAHAGLRRMPDSLSKLELDSWHKPRRVDVVLYDPFFEALVRPPPVLDEIQRVIGLLDSRGLDRALRS